jgi:hypothetical protein
MDRIPVDGLIERATYRYDAEGVASWGGGRGGEVASHNVVLYFPGDRLPGSLRGAKDESGSDPLQLGAGDIEALGAIHQRANALTNLTHTLDLQLPSVATDLVVAAFPRPIEPLSQRTNCIWHYLSIYPRTVTEEGFAVYSQFFDEGGLTERGEPQKGSYSPDSVAIPTIRALVADHLRRMLFDSTLGDEELLGLVTSLHMVGFSKGGVVLNKVATELAHTPPSAEVDSGPLGPLHVGMHFVDCGLNTAGAFIQERRVLDACFAPGHRAFLPSTVPRDMGYEVTVYTTPRQRCDPMRPWLDHERNVMTMHLGVPTVRPPIPPGWRLGTRAGLCVRCMDDNCGHPPPCTPLQGLHTHMMAMVRLCTHFRALSM